MTRLFRFVAALISVCALHFSPFALAQKPPIEDYFKYPAYRNISLNPSGTHLAAIVPNRDRYSLVIVDLDKKTGSIVARYNDADLQSATWISDKRLVYSLIDFKKGLDEQEGSGLYAIDLDGKDLKEIAPRSNLDGRGADLVWRHPQYVDRILDGSDDIYVMQAERSAKSPDVFRYDTRTGKKTMLTWENPGNAVAYWAHNNVVRAALSIDEKTQDATVYLRADDKSPWKPVSSFNVLRDPEAMMPLRFDYDGTLYVSSATGRDTNAIYKWDFAQNKLGEMIASHNRYDLSSLVFDRVKKKLVGVFANMDKPTTVWVDDEWAKIQSMADSALPGRVNLLTRSGGERVLVTSMTAQEPGRWYLLDPTKKTIEEVVAAMPWLKAEHLSERRFVQYKARDGLMIPAYLTLPKGKPAKNLPLVVLIHGGPYVRGEYFGFGRQEQFLASRGYAVLQADYRGSEGYGYKHASSGWKQWGQTMQNDITDGAMHLVSEGIVDKNRMCLMGGSYGGYATMQGLINEPDLWKCGINIVGVTDLMLLQRATWSDTSRWKGAEAFYKARVGDRDKADERAMLEKYSPVNNADKIKAPVFIAHGGGDIRVPIQHAEKMRAALRKQGAEPEWVVYDDEGHGFLREANNVDFNKRVEKFLEKHIGN